MGVEDQLQLHKRPGFGVSGKPLEVLVNCFRAIVPANIALTVYDCELARLTLIDSASDRFFFFAVGELAPVLCI